MQLTVGKIHFELRPIDAGVHRLFAGGVKTPFKFREVFDKDGKATIEDQMKAFVKSNAAAAGAYAPKA